MNFGIRFKLIALGLAVGLIGALIVFITLRSEKQISELRVRLNAVALESSGIIDQFRESVRKLNNAVLRYGTERNPEDWKASLNISRDLNDWINRQKTVLHGAAETKLLRQIQTAYDNYLLAVEDFHAKVRSLNGRNVSLADYTPVRLKTQRLLDLGQALARTHYESHNELLQQANRSLEKLHFSVLILLALLFVFGTAMAAGVYRNLIAPLRIKLVETQAFAERHEKLASLGLLASGAAHEIRNPLTSIKIGMSFQKNKFQPGTSERADAEVVEREILRLERILDDFLVRSDRLRRN